MKGRPVGMDVVYPSGRTDPVPLMLQITSTKERGKWINQRAYYIYGLLTTGYAGAIMDWNGTCPGAAPGGDVFPENAPSDCCVLAPGTGICPGELV